MAVATLLLTGCREDAPQAFGTLEYGAGLADLWPEFVALGAFTAVMMAFAIAGFRKRLD